MYMCSVEDMAYINREVRAINTGPNCQGSNEYRQSRGTSRGKSRKENIVTIYLKMVDKTN